MSATHEPVDDNQAADWHRRVVNRSLATATQRSIDRGAVLVAAATKLLDRSNGDGFTVQDVADEAGQSLRTLYQHFESKDDLLLAVFEEAMRAYALMIDAAIADLDDPLERLAGALVAAGRLPDRGARGVNRSMSRLRLKLAEVEPELVARAQAPVGSLFGALVDAAVEAGALPTRDSDVATFFALALNTTSIHSRTLGNDMGGRQPEPLEVVAFALNGLGAVVREGWLESVDTRLRLPAARKVAR